ncbi:MAG: hypothetical protein V5A38_13340 [Halolamina sp.]|uniref:hypothetical protein n=1 Tax=Halolamina sp. TaxID=1940283 RepID=UPI002FC2843C
MVPEALEQYRQPEYTGENRCLPCTAVNVAIALLLSAFASFIGTPVLGLLVLGGSLLSIYLRGYLIPGTPELTKAYLPDWVLATFDKAERPPFEPEPDLSEASEDPAAADSGAADTTATGKPASTETDGPADEALIDPETLLFEVDAIRETGDSEDIELTDAFADSLLEGATELRDDEGERATALAGLLGVEATDAIIEEEIHGPAFYAGEERLHRWPSEAALLADASAHRALAGRVQWETIAPAQRLGIARALRSFLSTCPVCGGAVGLTEETVSSCCRAWDVFAVRCKECEAHFLELEPRDIEDGEGELVEESEGARGVSGGFTR